MRYGEELRRIRSEREITLRQMARDSDIDVSYLSRVERGSTPPPQDPQLLDAIAQALKLTAKETQQLGDMAALDNKQLPPDVAAKADRLQGVPMLLRTVSNKRLTLDQVKDITRYIQDNY